MIFFLKKKWLYFFLKMEKKLMIEKKNHIKSWINSITNNITLRLVLKTRMHREQYISLSILHRVSASDLYQPKSHIGYIFTVSHYTRRAILFII